MKRLCSGGFSWKVVVVLDYLSIQMIYGASHFNILRNFFNML